MSAPRVLPINKKHAWLNVRLFFKLVRFAREKKNTNKSFENIIDLIDIFKNQKLTKTASKHRHVIKQLEV